MKLKLLTAALLLTALAACNTVSGVGKDISAAGSAISKGSDNAKK
jgi:entericidin B